MYLGKVWCCSNTTEGRFWVLLYTKWGKVGGVTVELVGKGFEVEEFPENFPICSVQEVLHSRYSGERVSLSSPLSLIPSFPSLPSSFPSFFPSSLPPSLSPSLPPSLSPSLSPSSLSLSLPPSLPPSLPSSLPPSLSPSLSPSSLSLSLPPSLPLSLPPSLPPRLSATARG